MKKLLSLVVVIVILVLVYLAVDCGRNAIAFGKARGKLMTEVSKEVYGEYLDGFFTGRDLTRRCYYIVAPMLDSGEREKYLQRLENMTQLRTELRQNAGFHVGDSYDDITTDLVGELYSHYYQMNPSDHGADEAEKWLASEESGLSVQYEHLRKLSRIHGRLDRIYWELMTCDGMEELGTIEAEYRSLLAEYEAEMELDVPRVSIKQNG